MASRRTLSRFLLLALLLAPWAAPAAVVETEHVRAELLSEATAVTPGESFWVALHFRLRAGWHLYWRNPGDSGEAPRVRWALPEGFAAGEILWPYPHRIRVGPLMNFGYSDEVAFLVELTAPPGLASDPVTLSAHADWLVCEEECIPESGAFVLRLPVSSAAAPPPERVAEIFRQARAELPRQSPWPASVNVGEQTLSLRIEAEHLDRGQIEELWFFPDRYGVVEHAAAQPWAVTGDGLELRLARGELRGTAPEPLSGVLVLTERLDEGAVTQAFTLRAPPTVPLSGAREPVAEAAPLGRMLLFALLGGLILNLMPCVFPVLSMKALALLEQARHGRLTVRLHGLAFTLGVLATFAAVAGVLLALRAAGEQVGWGFQLQSPVFVLALAWLLFALGLALSGLWSPGGRLMGVGQGLTTTGGLAGAFFTGALAVVVATPCTAPFMGAALGYALSQPAPLALAVFLSLGLGLALPWLALSLWPGLQRRLPRPGIWMERVKELLAFPLYATAAWLTWVLAQQGGATAVAAALAGAVVIAFLAWLWRHTRTAPRYWSRVGTAAVLAGAVLLLALARVPLHAGPASAAVPGEQRWEPFSAESLGRLRAQGTPVLVNFTAAWCITCLVNERVALGTDAVREAMEKRGVAYLKGDWTRRDPEITRVLEQFGRSGVPLYLLYPRGPALAPQVLPQLLTESLVLERLGRL